jgi:hypothetical protein
MRLRGGRLLSWGRLPSLPHDSFKSSRLSSPHPKVFPYCPRILASTCRKRAGTTAGLSSENRAYRSGCTGASNFLDILSKVNYQMRDIFSIGQSSFLRNQYADYYDKQIRGQGYFRRGVSRRRTANSNQGYIPAAEDLSAISGTNLQQTPQGRASQESAGAAGRVHAFTGSVRD